MYLNGMSALGDILGDIGIPGMDLEFSSQEIFCLQLTDFEKKKKFQVMHLMSPPSNISSQLWTEVAWGL